MSSERDEFMLKLLQACADRAPEPLYPSRYASEQNLDRDALDAALDELRRRGLIKLTDWVKDFGQGRTLTDAGASALKTRDLSPVAPEIAPPDAVPSTYERGEEAREALLYERTPYVSRALLVINILFFVYGGAYTVWHDFPLSNYLVGEDDPQRSVTHVLLDLGGLVRAYVLSARRPQFERLFLFFFLHVGLFHLLMNMYFLATLGTLIEAMWGWWRFIAIYLIGGIVSGCVIVIIDTMMARNTLTVGASGPLCGLFASMLVWFGMNYRHLPEQLLQDWSRNLMINSVLLIGVSLLPGVSWQGHLGGAIGGALAALLLHVQRTHPVVAIRVISLLAVPLVPVGFFFVMLWQAGWF